MRGVLGLTTATIVTMGAVTGCSGSSTPAPSTTKSPVVVTATETVTGTLGTNPSSASGSNDAEKAAVETAYRGFFEALVTVSRGGKVDQHAFDDVATPKAAQLEMKNISGLFGAGAHMVGDVSVTPKNIAINNSTATVMSCVDSTKWFSIPASETTPLPQDPGGKKGGARAIMIKGSDGKWRLDSRNPTDLTC